MLRYLSRKDSEEVKNPKASKKMPDTDKQDKAVLNGNKAAGKLEVN